jgi:hypothetical protein
MERFAEFDFLEMITLLVFLVLFMRDINNNIVIEIHEKDKI